MISQCHLKVDLKKYLKNFVFGKSVNENDYSEYEELAEASGYIPSEKEKNDPRWCMALTKDVRPDAIRKNAKAFGFKTSRAGIPPQARPDGKIK